MDNRLPRHVVPPAELYLNFLYAAPNLPLH